MCLIYLLTYCCMFLNTHTFNSYIFLYHERIVRMSYNKNNLYKYKNYDIFIQKMPTVAFNKT